MSRIELTGQEKCTADQLNREITHTVQGTSGIRGQPNGLLITWRDTCSLKRN